MKHELLIARNKPDPDPPPPPNPDPFPPPQPPLPDPQPPTPPVRPPIPQLPRTASGTRRSPKEDHMTALPLIGLSLIMTLFIAGPVSANPNMLPKHEGYPMGKATDPVSGQPLSNDPGQKNATGTKALEQAAAFDDQHSRQDLPANRNDRRVLEKPGAGVLPKVEGPQIKIEPPVKEATKAQANPND